MIRYEVENLSHAVRVQLCDPGVVFFAGTDRCVQLIVIGNVVSVHALGAGLEIGRGIDIADTECAEVGNDFARPREREPSIELQSIGANRNTRMFSFHSKEGTSDSQPAFARLLTTSFQEL